MEWRTSTVWKDIRVLFEWCTSSACYEIRVLLGWCTSSVCYEIRVLLGWCTSFTCCHGYAFVLSDWKMALCLSGSIVSENL